jgi:hypothetical protein
MGNLLIQSTLSVVPMMPSASTASGPSSPILEDSIFFGSFEFTPKTFASRSTFLGLRGGMDLTIGSVHLSISPGGILRLPEPINLGTYNSREFVDCHVCCFITNRGRFIGCNCIKCADNTDRVGSAITISVIIASYHDYNVRWI